MHMAALDAPEDLVRIVRDLERAGHSAWAVGGAVRDALSGHRPEDWDVATSARPGEVRKIFRRTVPVGIEHGTVGVLTPGGRMYEVTTFRRDVETFGRKARVTFSDTIEDDLQRRDFTINAVAWHPLTQEVRDPHGGVADLNARLLQTVGDPRERFAEDRLRVLRALRFAGRFDMRIEAATRAALEEASADLANLSAERVREELWKVLSGQPRPSASLGLYAATGVLREWYPELEAVRGPESDEVGGDVWAYLLRSVDRVTQRNLEVRLAALFHYTVPEPGEAAQDHAFRSAAIARGALRRLRHSNAQIDLVGHRVARSAPLPLATGPAPAIRRWLRVVGRDHVRELFRLLFATHGARPSCGEALRALRVLHHRSHLLLNDGTPLSIGELPIGGAELRGLGIRPGPVYGEILDDMLDRVTNDPALNEREALLAIVRSDWVEGSGSPHLRG